MIAVGTCEWCGIVEYAPTSGVSFHGPSCPKAEAGYFIAPAYASTEIGVYDCSVCGAMVLPRATARHNVWHEQLWYAAHRQQSLVRRFEDWFASPNVNLMA